MNNLIAIMIVTPLGMFYIRVTPVCCGGRWMMGNIETVLQAVQLWCEHKFSTTQTILVGLSVGWMSVECGLVSCLKHES